MDVDQYVANEASRPFEWGVTDCASTADRWVEMRTGVSPMAAFGRSHNCEADARSWLAEVSLPVSVNRVMRAAGFFRTKSPIPGDIGLVRVNEQICVAILTSHLWFSRCEAGLLGSPTFWKAWSII